MLSDKGSQSIYIDGEVEEGSLLGFATFNDLQVSLEKGAEAKVPLNIQDLWLVTLVLGVCMVLGWRMRTRIVPMKIWTRGVKLPVAWFELERGEG